MSHNISNHNRWIFVRKWILNSKRHTIGSITFFFSFIFVSLVFPKEDGKHNSKSTMFLCMVFFFFKYCFTSLRKVRHVLQNLPCHYRWFFSICRILNINNVDEHSFYRDSSRSCFSSWKNIPRNLSHPYRWRNIKLKIHLYLMFIF